MPGFPTSPDEKFEGFDFFLIKEKAHALQSVQELKEKPEMLKAVQKYLEEEAKETRTAIDLAENL